MKSNKIIMDINLNNHISPQYLSYLCPEAQLNSVHFIMKHHTHQIDHTKYANKQVKNLYFLM